MKTKKQNVVSGKRTLRQKLLSIKNGSITDINVIKKFRQQHNEVAILRYGSDVIMLKASDIIKLVSKATKSII